jgi:hypothetical protein
MIKTDQLSEIVGILGKTRRIWGQKHPFCLARVWVLKKVSSKAL